VIHGTSGVNFFNGNGGSDTFFGQSGNDWLDGGTGADILNGGYGNDTYIVDDSGDQGKGAYGRLLLASRHGHCAFVGQLHACVPS